MKVFAFAGLPAAGKTFHAERLSKEYGIPLIETGQILYEEVKRKGLPVTKENVKKVWEELKSKDRAILTRLAIQKIKQDYKDKDKEMVLISSPKCLKEVELLRKSFDECYLIAFVSSPRTRFRRAIELKYSDTKSVTKEKKREIAELDTVEKFKDYRDGKEIKLGVGKVIAIANRYIDTEKTQEEANFEVKQLFDKLK